MFSKTKCVGFLNGFRTRFYVSKRGAGKWFPDAEWLREFDGPVMYPNEVNRNWKRLPWNAKMSPAMKKVKNTIVNFGPAHPAAHGVLRMLVELEGEVNIILDENERS